MQDNQSNSNFPNGVNPNQPGVNQPPNAGGGSFAPHQGMAPNMPRPTMPQSGQGANVPPQQGMPGQMAPRPNMPNQSVNNVNPSFNPANNQGAPNQMGVNPNMPRPNMPQPGQGVNVPPQQGMPGQMPGQVPNGQPAGQMGGQQNPPQQEGGAPKEKGKKRKKAILLVVTFLIAAIGGIFAAMTFLSNKTYSINFETGPFGNLDKATVQGGELYDVPNDLNDIVNKDGNVLVEFTGWYTDKDCTTPYVASKINSDLTLYAGYETFPVNITFVSPNYMSDNGYVYLTSISPKYYDGKIDFDSEELLQAIYNLNTDIYAKEGENLYSYNPLNGNKSSLSIETADYVGYIDNYYGILHFTSEDGETIYNFSDEIATPREESVYYVIFQPNEVKINFNSNLSGLNDYYESLGGADYNENNFVNQYASVPKNFKDPYTLLNYISYNALGLTNPNPSYHKFLGWSSIAPGETGFGEEGNYYKENQTITLNSAVLNNQTEVTLYAVWQVIDTGLVINTSYDKNNNIYGSVRDSISMGETKNIQDIISSLNLEKEGYALVGFNSKADGTGEIVNIEGELVGNRSSSYYDKESDSLILYAVYKKIVNNTYVLLNDDDLDVVDYQNFIDNFEFNLNLSSYTNAQQQTISYHYDESGIEVVYDATKDAVNIKNLIEGATFTLPLLVRENYNLEKYIINEKDHNKGADYALNINDFELSGDANINISAIWAGLPYALRFYPVYPSAEKQTDDMIPVSLTYGSQVYMISTQSQEDDVTVVSTYLCNAVNSTPISGSSFTIRLRGYAFTGWNKAELVGVEPSQNLVVSNEKVQNQTPFIVNSEFNSVAANWLVNLYDVTYYLNGGTYDGSTDVQIIRDVPFGSTITLIGEDALTREDFYFDGWSKTSGQDQNVDYSYNGEEIVIEKDLQLYAVWAQKYYINLYADVTRATSARVTVDRDGTYDLLGTEIAGYTFTKYNTTTLGDGTEYVIGTNLVYGLEENTNLYAMWFNVSFANGNNANYGVIGDDPESFSITYGASFVLPTNPYVCAPYYKFNNWSYESKTGLDFFTADEETTTFTMNQTNVGKDIEFVAGWIYKNVKLNVYTNQNKTKLHYSKIVDVNRFEVETLYQANAQFPSIENKEIDYFTDGNIAFFTVADGDSSKVEISIPKPAQGMTFDAGSDAYIYNVYPMWKLTVQYLGNNRSADQVIKYVPAVYTDVNNNSKIELSEISSEYETVLINNEFVFENRNFIGWATTANAENGEPAGTVVSLTRDVVYYAVWEFKNFKVKFVDSKNTFTDGVFVYNEVKTLIDCGFPTDLTGFVTNYYDEALGYYKNFVGFTYNNGEERLLIKPTDELTFATLDDGGFIANDEFASDNTIELTVAWEEQTYMITVNLLGGTLQDLSLLNGLDIQYIRDDVEGTYKLKYTVKYSDVKSSADGLSLIYDSLAKNKYRFNGFAPTDTSLSMVIAPGAASEDYIYKYVADAQSFNASAGDVINVVWQEIYTLAFNANGANGQIDRQTADAISGTANFVIPANDNSVVYPYAGVDFVGWWFTNDVNDIKQNLASLYNWNSPVVVDSQVMAKYGVENVVTLYAVWQTTVTFQAGLPQGVNATGYHTPTTEETTGITYFTDVFYCGDNVTADVLISYYFTIDSDGYRFGGWQFNGSLISEITINQPITLIASWGNSYIHVYLKDYDGNDFVDGTGETTPVDIEILYDPSVSIDLNNYYKEETGNSALPTRFGYEFVGWKVGLTNTTVSANKVGELTIYNSTNKFSLPNSSITLYAVYKIAVVRVVYDINNAGATNVEGEGNKIVEGIEYNTAYKVVGADYALDYHQIVCWTYTNKQGETLEVENGESVSLLEEYGVVKSASGDYILTLFAQWERVTNTVQINLGTGLFSNTGLDEANPLEEFYGVDDYIVAWTYDVDKIILEVYQGDKTEGYGFKLPGKEYVYNLELFEVVSYSDRNGNTYDFNTLYSVTENITINADWARLVEIHVYKNLPNDLIEEGEVEEEIVFRAQLNTNLDFAIKQNAPHINETAITYADDDYNLMGYNTNALGTGKGYSIEQGFVLLNATNFTIKNTFKMDLFCQWQGDPIVVTIDYRDNAEEQYKTIKVLEGDKIKYGVEIDLIEHVPTSRSDGNQGYEFASFEDEFGTLYAGDNLVLKTGLLDFRENYLLTVNWKAKQFVLTYELPSALYNGDMSEFISTSDPESGVAGEGGIETTDVGGGETEPVVDRSKFSKFVEYGSTVSLIDSSLIVNTTNNEEFPILVFDGYQSSISINNSTKIEGSFVMPASDVVLTGLWKSRNFMLVINSGEGIFDDGSNRNVLTGYDFSQEINLPIDEAPTREGYTLQYRYDYFYTEEAGAFTRTKLLAPDAEFKFTLYNNSMVSDNPAEESGLAGDLAYIWDEEEDSFIIELYAVWTPIQYVVVFDRNTPNTQNGYDVNASGSVEGNIQDMIFTYDQAQDISSKKYSLTGWTLYAWNSQPDGQGSVILISQDGATMVNNLTNVAGTSVTLYAMWRQNEYTLTFEDLSGENTGANAIENQNILFDSTFVLDELIFEQNPIIALTFDEAEGVYKEFIGWKYIYNGTLSERIYTNDQEILFALTSNSGFVGNAEDLVDNTVTLRAVWQEVTYNLILDLKGATYNNPDGLGATFNSDTKTFNIVIPVKYSDLSNGTGIDLTVEGIKFDSSKVAYDYAFAGWSKDSNVNYLHFVDGENIEFEGLTLEQLNPINKDIFKVYAMYDIYKITVNGNGGNVVEEKETEIRSQGWSVSEDKTYISIFTHKNSSITIPTNINNWFERENYHVDLDASIANKQIIEIVEDKAENIAWFGNIRYVVLDTIEVGATIDYSAFSDAEVTDGGFRLVTGVTADNFASYYVYNYDKTTDTGSFALATRYEADREYFTTVPAGNSIRIKTYYGQTIDTLKLILAEGNETFKGWVDKSGNQNYSLRPLTVGGTDNEVIQLFAAWKDIFLFIELNGGTYKVFENGSYVDKTEIPKITGDPDETDAGIYHFKIPAKVTPTLSPLGPNKIGYTFLGWSDAYMNYDKFAQAGKPTSALINNNNQNSVTYTISDGYSKLYMLFGNHIK